MSHADTFIPVADDCPATTALPPPAGRAVPSRALLEFELLQGAPCSLDHDALNHEIHCRQRAAVGDAPLARDKFLAKGHPCLRASSLTRRYGWGAHYDTQGKIAIFPMESSAYSALANDNPTRKLKAMRNKRG